jgi:hypothetical protein
MKVNARAQISASAFARFCNPTSEPHNIFVNALPKPTIYHDLPLPVHHSGAAIVN